MSPTTIFFLADSPVQQLYGDQQHVGRGRGVPGVVGRWVGRRGTIPGTHPVLLQDPYLVYF